MKLYIFKQVLTNNPILKLPNPNKPHTLITDTFDVDIKAILLQEYDGKLYPNSFDGEYKQKSNAII